MTISYNVICAALGKTPTESLGTRMALVGCAANVERKKKVAGAVIDREGTQAVQQNKKMANTSNREPAILLLLTVFTLVLSGVNPKDQLIWFLEVAPVLIAIPLLIVTYKRFRLTSLLYRLLFIHALILLLGGHYTYAEVPLGIWAQQAFDLSRNHYDRVGHFAQGFVPAILAREILIRRSPLSAGKWLFFLVSCVCLAFSAFYELIEWWAAILDDTSAEAFLGTQGDVWDTQWDMFIALSGAVLAQLSLAKLHDQELNKIAAQQSNNPIGVN